MSLPDDFNVAVPQSKNLPARPSTEDLLQLCALLEQATQAYLSLVERLEKYSN